MSSQTNVDRLRQENVIPQGLTLNPEHEKAINRLSPTELDAVLKVHKKVGTVEVTDPLGRLFIF